MKAAAPNAARSLQSSTPSCSGTTKNDWQGEKAQADGQREWRPCGRCGKSGHAENDCPDFPLPRGAPWNAAHADAQLGDHVPHMRQVRWELLRERTLGGSEIVRIEGRDFYFGEASGDDNNCLIDTLKQKLKAFASLQAVRRMLMDQYPAGPRRVTDENYLELEYHWRHVIEFLGAASNNVTALNPDRYRIVCIDRGYPGNGDVEGNGAITLHIARVNANHFAPLFPYHALCRGTASAAQSQQSAEEAQAPA